VRRARQDAHDLLDGVVRQVGVDTVQPGSEAAFQQDLCGIAALARVVDLDTTLDRRAVSCALRSMLSNFTPRNAQCKRWGGRRGRAEAAPGNATSLELDCPGSPPARA